jgi:predicted N-formylglutamate amidohydrolase
LHGKLAAPLVYPDASRLLIDCNRPPTAPDSMPVLSEDTPIPGNRDLAEELRARRIRDIYDAYHAAIEAVIEARTPAPTALVAVHSFTPVYRGRSRPWHVGLVVAEDRRLADPLFAALRADAALVVGENQPYAPTDGVYHTLERHAGGRGIPAVMIEIRNDQIATPETQEAWASRLAAALADAL